MNPRFPIYIVSKGRHETRLTSKALERIGVPYFIVVEEQEYKDYCARIDPVKVLVLDKAYQRDYDTFDKLADSKSKGPGPARNFVWDHSILRGHAWHWVMDDNIREFHRLNCNLKMPVDGTAFHCMEEFVLRYKNVAMAGPNYDTFVDQRLISEPIRLNTRIYSCNLIRNDTGFRWRGRYNEDTDLSLRMLKAGWCTVLFNVFLQEKKATQKLGGGNTKEFYISESTVNKSKMLFAMHPDVTKIKWKWNRWHHEVDYGRFKQTKLIRDSNVAIPNGSNDFGMRLRIVPKGRYRFTHERRYQRINGTKSASILDRISKDDLRDYLTRCAEIVPLNVERAFGATIEAIKQHKANQDITSPEFQSMFNRWYGSIKNGKPDYSVYDDPYYLCEVWLCWVAYSRRYLKMIQQGKFDGLSGIKSLVDLGCGFGYTTAGLKLLYPNANAIGTNLRETNQWKIAEKLSKQFGFTLATTIPQKTDLIFASEFFEHIETPVEYLIKVLHEAEPKFLLIANSFDTQAIGHFNRYKHDGKRYEPKQISRMFNDALREHGYKKIKTTCWNNRPAYWKQQA